MCVCVCVRIRVDSADGNLFCWSEAQTKLSTHMRFQLAYIKPFQVFGMHHYPCCWFGQGNRNDYEWTAEMKINKATKKLSDFEAWEDFVIFFLTILCSVQCQTDSVETFHCLRLSRFFVSETVTCWRREERRLQGRCRSSPAAMYIIIRSICIFKSRKLTVTICAVNGTLWEIWDVCN